MKESMGAPCFANLLPRPVLVGIVTEAPRIEIGGIETVAALDDALGQVIADGTAPQNAARYPLGKPDILQTPGRAHQGQFIRRHLKWPANIRLYARTPQRRKQFDGLLPVR